MSGVSTRLLPAKTHQCRGMSLFGQHPHLFRNTSWHVTFGQHPPPPVTTKWHVTFEPTTSLPLASDVSYQKPPYSARYCRMKMKVAPTGSCIISILSSKFSSKTGTLHTRVVLFHQTLQHSLNQDFKELQCLRGELFAVGMRPSTDEKSYVSEDLFDCILGTSNPDYYVEEKV